MFSASAPGFSAPILPSYVQGWPGSIRRADERDLRHVPLRRFVPRGHAFVQHKPGESESSIITRIRCTNCKSAGRNDCSRDDPCTHCANGGFRCRYPPGPYRLATIVDTSQREHEYSNPKKDPPLSLQTPVDEPELVSVSDPLPQYSNNLFNASIETPVLQEAQQETPRHIQEQQQANSDAQPTGKPRQPAAKITSRRGNTTWAPIDMNSLKSDPKPRMKPDRKPYLWSETYEELLGAVPLLPVINNGVSAQNDLSPLVLLSSSSWSSDWNGSGFLKLTTVWRFSCPPSALGSQAGSSRHPDMQLESSAEHSAPPEVWKTSNEDDEEIGSEEELEYLKEDEMEMELCVEPNESLSLPFVTQQGLQSFPDYSSDFPKTPPAEISTLRKAYDDGMPISAIMEAGWTGSPFKPHEGCGFAVLGFFHIMDVQYSTSSKEIPRKNGGSIVTGRMSWSFTLRWLPSGPSDYDIPVDLDGRPHSLPPVPWWSASIEAPAKCIGPTLHKELFEPYFVGATIVAQSILLDAFSGESGSTDASKRSWVCRWCGRIGLTNWIGKYFCSYCHLTVSGPAKIIQPFSVRNRHRFIPMWEPSMQVPEGVSRRSTSLDNGCRHFTFILTRETSKQVLADPLDSPLKRVGKGKGKEIESEQLMEPIRDAPTVVVEMFFLGNRASLEVDADASFVAFQKDCPMRFERIDHRGTAGIYTYQIDPYPVSEYSTEEGYADWISAPACIRTAAERMANHAKRHLDQDMDILQQHALAIAWLGDSPVKKCLPIRAKQSLAMLMCLGADLDIVFPKPGEVMKQKSPSKAKSRSKKLLSAGVEEEHTETSRAGKFDEIWTGAERSETNKALTAADRFRLTMTHGSIVIISGDDIEVTVIRSDFAILVCLFPA